MTTTANGARCHSIITLLIDFMQNWDSKHFRVGKNHPLGTLRKKQSLYRVPAFQHKPSFSIQTNVLSLKVSLQRPSSPSPLRALVSRRYSNKHHNHEGRGHTTFTLAKSTTAFSASSLLAQGMAYRSAIVSISDAQGAKHHRVYFRCARARR